MATLAEQLDAMLTLPENWDGYGAATIQPRPVEFAKEFVGLLTAFHPPDQLRDIHVSPGRAGGVLIEWADSRAEHELEIEPDGLLGFLHEDITIGEMTELRFTPTAYLADQMK